MKSAVSTLKILLASSSYILLNLTLLPRKNFCVKLSQSSLPQTMP